MFTLPIVALGATGCTVLLFSEVCVALTLETLCGRKALVAVRTARLAGSPDFPESFVKETIRTFTFALLHRCQVAVVFALGAMQAVLAGIAVVWTSDTHPPHFSFSIFKVASWACLCAPLVVSEILGGLALQAPIPPFTLGAVLCTKLAHATNTVGPRKIEEAVWTGRFTLAIGCEEQTILALAAPGLIGTLTAARFAGYTFSI